MHKDVKLYNVLFPIWMLVLFPLTWLIVLPGNFIIDFTVVALTMKFLKLPDIIKTTKAVIIRVWLMGFVADFIGTAGMLLSNFLDSWVDTDFTYDLMFAVNYNPFESIWGFLWVTVLSKSLRSIQIFSIRYFFKIYIVIYLITKNCTYI